MIEFWELSCFGAVWSLLQFCFQKMFRRVEGSKVRVSKLHLC